jgi:hypothetical protein
VAAILAAILVVDMFLVEALKALLFRTFKRDCATSVIPSGLPVWMETMVPIPKVQFYGSRVEMAC